MFFICPIQHIEVREKNEYEVTLTSVIGLYTAFVIHLTFLNSEWIVFPSAGRYQG